jgi:hypothetical protein
MADSVEGWEGSVCKGGEEGGEEGSEEGGRCGGMRCVSINVNKDVSVDDRGNL